MTADRPRELLAEVIVNLASATEVVIELRDRQDPDLVPSLDSVEKMLGQIADDLDTTWDDDRPHARNDALRQLDRASAIAGERGLGDMADCLRQLAESLRRLADPGAGGAGGARASGAGRPW